MKRFLVLIAILVIGMPVLAYTSQEASDLLAKRLLSPDSKIQFFYAITTGDAEVTELFIDAGQIEINERYMGSPYLLYATLKGQSETALLLLAKGADPKIKSIDGGSSLFYAVKNDLTEVVEKILKDSNINIKRHRPFFRAPLITTAKRHGNDEMVEMLINYKEKYEAKN